MAKRIKVVALENLSGRYKLPYRAGQVFETNKERADELIANRDARLWVATDTSDIPVTDAETVAAKEAAAAAAKAAPAAETATDKNAAAAEKQVKAGK